MEYSRREALALGGGLATGALVGGLVGARLPRRVDEPTRRIVATRDEETAEAACEAIDGEERVVDLGSRRTLVVGRLDDEDVAELAAEYKIDYVEPDLPVTAPETAGAATSVPTTRADGARVQEEVPWGIRRVNALEAHDAGYRGAGARVAVLDSGVAAHPDVEPNLAGGVSFLDCESDCRVEWDDEAGHGTACAGVVAATGVGDGLVGVAPEATLHPVKVLGADNTGRVSLVAEGLRWAAERRCEVANLSLSGSASRAFDDAVGFAVARGTLPVVSAGNVGPCVDCINPLAAHESVIAVTATNRNDDLATFSATGGEAELTAPGVGVRTTGLDDYVTVNGTSFSAPHVSGVAALCRAEGRTARTTREILASTADRLPLLDVEQGRGVVDAAGAVVPGVRTLLPTVDGRRVTLRGSLPRVEGGETEVWFSYRWRMRGRWHRTLGRRRSETGTFSSTVRLRRGLRYVVRAHAHHPGYPRVSGGVVHFRVPLTE